MMELDTSILLWVNGHYNGFLDSFMPLVSGKLEWLPLYVAILVLLFMRYKFSRQLLIVLAAIGLTFFLTDFVCSHVIRPFFARLRPISGDNPVHSMLHLLYPLRGQSYGFPSCHASNTFGLATMVWLLFGHRRAAAVMFLWAAMICYSRVYLGMHYPGDVLVGAIVGIFVADVVYGIAQRVAEKCSAPLGIVGHAKWLVVVVAGITLVMALAYFV